MEGKEGLLLFFASFSLFEKTLQTSLQKVTRGISPHTDSRLRAWHKCPGNSTSHRLSVLVNLVSIFCGHVIRMKRKGRVTVSTINETIHSFVYRQLLQGACAELFADFASHVGTRLRISRFALIYTLKERIKDPFSTNCCSNQLMPSL